MADHFDRWRDWCTTRLRELESELEVLQQKLQCHDDVMRHVVRPLQQAVTSELLEDSHRALCRQRCLVFFSCVLFSHLSSFPSHPFMVLQRFLEFAQGIIQQQQAVLERESEDLALLAVKDVWLRASSHTLPAWDSTVSQMVTQLSIS